MTASDSIPVYLKLTDELNTQGNSTLLSEGLSFDDIKILPQKSKVNSTSKVFVKMKLIDCVKLDVDAVRIGCKGPSVNLLFELMGGLRRME